MLNLRYGSLNLLLVLTKSHFFHCFPYDALATHVRPYTYSPPYHYMNNKKLFGFHFDNIDEPISSLTGIINKRPLAKTNKILGWFILKMKHYPIAISLINKWS